MFWIVVRGRRRLLGHRRPPRRYFRGCRQELMNLVDDGVLQVVGILKPVDQQIAELGGTCRARRPGFFWEQFV